MYSELAKQLEQARIKVKEDTPVFSIVEEVTVPVERSKPHRSLILILWTLLGGILGVALVIAKYSISAIKNRWNEA